MAKSASSLVNGVLDPVLAKRAGLSIALVDAWPEIAGVRTAKLSCPLRIDWPRRKRDDAFEPGVLVVAANGSAALYLQHESAEIIGRVNAFMGFAAIARVRIVQRTVGAAPAPKRVEPRPLTDDEKARIDDLAEAFEDEALARSIRRLGENVLRERRTERG